MKLYNTRYLLPFLFLVISMSQIGCEKQDEWLDVKQRKSDVVPETLADFQAILDNTTTLTNSFALASSVGSDDVYLPDANLTAASEPERNLYLWNRDIWVNNTSYDWNTYYKMLENANIVIDGLSKLKSQSGEFNNNKGQALFWRAISLYNLAQLFSKPFSPNTAAQDLGIPTRTSSDVNIIFPRGTVQNTYEQITKDLIEASNLLPSNAPYLTRPIKAAALGLLARVYLNMENYTQAFYYANLCIKERGILLDFNSNVPSLALTYRFPANGANNPEILFYGQGAGYVSISPSTGSTGFVDPDLYGSYEPNDLRKTIYYASSTNGLFKIRATYTGSGLPFFGIAINEIYLIRAECFARAGKTLEAMQDLNELLKNRYKAGLFTQKTASSPDMALQIILVERRKELAFIGSLRWEDLRRLNKDSRFAKTLTRTANGKTYVLQPNDARYVLPIPLDEMQLTNIEPNNR